MKNSYLALLILLITETASAQITTSVTSDRDRYVYDEIIKITMTISNNSENEVITYRGSSTLKAVVKSFSGIELIPDIILTDEVRDTIHVGETREIRWQLDPSELALPAKDGNQTVVVRGLSVVDSIKFYAPKFTGGEVLLYFKEETELEIVDQIRDSLNVRSIAEDHPSYRWYIREFMVDSVISDLLSRDYVLEARVPGRGAVGPIAHISTKMEDIPVIPEFELSQNFPNPFNPSTQIPIKLQKPGFVELSVYDMAGQKIETIISDRFSQGSHVVTFNAQNLSSGTYIYRLKTESGTVSKKFTLIK
jgi:hypothetical protein